MLNHALAESSFLRSLVRRQLTCDYASGEVWARFLETRQIVFACVPDQLGIANLILGSLALSVTPMRSLCRHLFIDQPQRFERQTLCFIIQNLLVSEGLNDGA